MRAPLTVKRGRGASPGHVTSRQLLVGQLMIAIRGPRLSNLHKVLSQSLSFFSGRSGCYEAWVVFLPSGLAERRWLALWPGRRGRIFSRSQRRLFVALRVRPGASGKRPIEPPADGNGNAIEQPRCSALLLTNEHSYGEQQRIQGWNAQAGALPRTDPLASNTCRRRGSLALCANSPYSGGGAVNKKREKVRTEMFGSSSRTRKNNPSVNRRSVLPRDVAAF
jgi:hypothetical protein